MLKLLKGKRQTKTCEVSYINVFNSVADKKQLTLDVHNRLYAVYKDQIVHAHANDPLSELVDTILSQRTKNRDSAQGFNNLLTRFVTWENVRDAPELEVRKQIEMCTWPDQKVKRLQDVLKLITEKQGSLTLDFLKNMDVGEARAWLEALPGVGPKTSGAVMSYSNLQARALAVDSHHYRVAVRLGIIDAKTGEAKANRILENLLPPEFTAQQVFDNHQLMMKHGQKICFYHQPDCKHCVLLDICPTGMLLASKQVQLSNISEQKS